MSGDYRHVAIATIRCHFGSTFMGSVAPRMGVAEPLRRPTTSRGRKRPRAAVRLVGAIRAACCRSRLRVALFFVLVVVLWCVGNPDLWDRGLVCFWGTFLLWLVYPNLPIAWAQARARITRSHVSLLSVALVIPFRVFIDAVGGSNETV